MEEYKNFRWAEIINDESQIVKLSAFYMIPMDDETFKVIVVDENGNRRSIYTTGLPGENATIQIGSVENLNPGEFPTVTNIGSPTNAILEFGIPRGEKGEDGVDGTFVMYFNDDFDI